MNKLITKWFWLSLYRVIKSESYLVLTVSRLNKKECTYSAIRYQMSDELIAEIQNDYFYKVQGCCDTVKEAKKILNDCEL